MPACQTVAPSFAIRYRNDAGVLHSWGLVQNYSNADFCGGQAA